MKKLAIAAFFVATSMMAGATIAQEKKQDLTPAQQTENRLSLEIARNLVSYGEAKSDALALVTAAKIVARCWPTIPRAKPAPTRQSPSTSRPC